jgi:HWE histidine kinase
MTEAPMTSARAWRALATSGAGAALTAFFHWPSPGDDRQPSSGRGCRVHGGCEPDCLGRVKNTLVTLQSIAGQSFRDVANEGVRKTFNARLITLAKVGHF